jgi:hypothetical protein
MRRHSVCYLFCQKVGLACKLQGLDVCKAGIVAQHFAVDEANHVLLSPALVELRIREALRVGNEVRVRALILNILPRVRLIAPTTEHRPASTPPAPW